MNNPYVWNETAESVRSEITALNLKNETNGLLLIIANLTKPIDLRIPKKDAKRTCSDGKVMYKKALQHEFMISQNKSSISIEISPKGNFTHPPVFVVRLKKGSAPLQGDKDVHIRVVPNQIVKSRDSDVQGTHVLFYPDSNFNGTTAGLYYVVIEYNGTTNGSETPSNTVEYSFCLFTSRCLFWNETEEAWTGTGCEVWHNIQ